MCIVCIIDLVPRSWIAQLGSRCDPEKRKAIKEKGDTGMVKKTVSKTTNKKTVSSTQFLFSAYVEYTEHNRLQGIRFYSGAGALGYHLFCL